MFLQLIAVDRATVERTADEGWVWHEDEERLVIVNAADIVAVWQVWPHDDITVLPYEKGKQPERVRVELRDGRKLFAAHSYGDLTECLKAFDVSELALVESGGETQKGRHDEAGDEQGGKRKEK